MIVCNARPGDGCLVSLSGTIFEADAQGMASAISQADGGRLELLVCSSGGDLEAGFSIRNLISSYKGAVEVHAVGPVHSAASVAVCVRNARVIAHKGSMFMLHCCSTMAEGNADELRKMCDVLEKYDDQLVRVYSERIKADEGRILKMLKSETWLSAEEAVELGLADELYEEEKDVPAIRISDFRSAFERKSDDRLAIAGVRDLVAGIKNETDRFLAVSQNAHALRSQVEALNANSKTILDATQAVCDLTCARFEEMNARMGEIVEAQKKAQTDIDAFKAISEGLVKAFSTVYNCETGLPFPVTNSSRKPFSPAAEAYIKALKEKQ